MQTFEHLPSNILETFLKYIIKEQTLMTVLKVLSPHLHLAAIHTAIPRFIAARHDILQDPAFRLPTYETASYKSASAVGLITLAHGYHTTDEGSCRIILMIFKRISGLLSYDLLRPLGRVLDTWSYDELSEYMSQFKCLKELDLMGAELGPEPVEVLAAHLTNLTCLEVLSLRRNALNDQGARALAPHISKLHTLKVLDLSHNAISRVGLAFLAPALRSISTLERLNLSFNHMSGQALEILAEHLCRLASLTHIALRSCWYDPVDYSPPLAALCTSLHTLKCIDFGEVNLNSKVMDGLSSMPSLEQIQFSKVRVDAESIGLLGRLSGLKHLEFHTVRSDDGVVLKFLAPHFSHLTMLTALLLVSSMIGDDEDIAALRQHISGLRSLEALSLQGNGICSSELHWLTPEFAKLPALKHLDVSKNRIRHRDPLEEHFSGLTALTGLQSLDLSNNWLRESGARSLLPHVQHLSSLTCLNLTRCFGAEDDNVDAVEYLRSHLPDHLSSALRTDDFPASPVHEPPQQAAVAPF